MTEIVVEGFEQTVAGLDELGKIAYKRAAADALTDTAFIIQGEEKKEVGKTFDGYVSFTERAFRVLKASFKKDPIQAEVFIAPIQAQYLRYQILGGRRKEGDYATTGGGVMLPVNARLNGAGNFPSPVRFLAKTGTTRGAGSGKGSEFVGIPNGAPNDFERYYGIWRREGKGGRGYITMVAGFRRAVDYPANNFKFYDVANATFFSRFDKSFDQKLSVEISRLPPGWST
jgi:hypothetical protein